MQKTKPKQANKKLYPKQMHALSYLWWLKYAATKIFRCGTLTNLRNHGNSPSNWSC